MCGGIVGALSLGAGSRPELHMAYNSGRIASYALAGAMPVPSAERVLALSGQLPLRHAMFWPT